MSKLVITVPAGSVVIAAGQLIAQAGSPLYLETNIEYDSAAAYDPNVSGISLEDAFDKAAAEICAGGRTELLSGLTHTYSNPEVGAVRVVYTPIGQRVEQSFEDHAAAIATAEAEASEDPDLGRTSDSEGDVADADSKGNDQPVADPSSAELGRSDPSQESEDPGASKSNGDAGSIPPHPDLNSLVEFKNGTGRGRVVAIEDESTRIQVLRIEMMSNADGSETREVPGEIVIVDRNDVVKTPIEG